MATEADKSVQFISKLVQLTQEKRVRWEADIPSAQFDSSTHTAYTASIEGRRMRISRIKKPLTVDDILSGRVGTKATRSVQASILEIMDDFGQTTFTFDGVTGLSDLYESAAFSASRIDDLMDSVLRRK